MMLFVFENFDNDSQIPEVPNSIDINGSERITENLKEGKLSSFRVSTTLVNHYVIQ